MEQFRVMDQPDTVGQQTAAAIQNLQLHDTLIAIPQR